MTATTKVLFAVDFKAGCEKAIKDLIEISKYRPMAITLMTVYNQNRFEERDRLYPAAALKQDEFKSKIKFSLEDQLDAWAKKHLAGIKAEHIVEFGDPAQIFADASGRYDWLVIGANKHGLVDKVFMNSMAENIVGRVFKPSIILRNKMAGTKEATLLVDLGDHPEQVLKSAFNWAKSMNLNKVNVRTYYPMPIEIAAFAASSVAVFTSDEISKLMKELQSGLDKMVQKFANGVAYSVEVKKVPASSIATEISNDMKTHSETIIIGRKQRSVLSEFFLGSVALGLMRQAKSDLVILPVVD